MTIAGVSRTSLALARALLDDGARVAVAQVGANDPALDDELDELLAAGAVSVGDLASAPETPTVYVDGSRGPVVGSAWVEAARRRGAAITNATAYAVARAPIPTLGATGTAGKSSVTALVAHLLRAGGVAVHASSGANPETQFGVDAGVIGALPSMRSGMLVLELASQGLALMDVSPDIAVVTNLSPDHLADHGSFEAYVEAKSAILRHQTSAGWAVLPEDEELLARFEPVRRARLATFGVADVGRDTAVLVRDGRIVGRRDGSETALGAVPADRVTRENVLAACAAALVAGVEPAAIATALPTFPGLPFRRQLVAEARGVIAINDGLAVTPGKARAGLEAIGRPIVWIAGGRASFRSETSLDPAARRALPELARVARERVRAAVVFGPMAPVLGDALRSVAVKVVEVHDLTAAVATAASIAERGDAIMLAPAVYLPPEQRSRFDDLVPDALGRRQATAPER